MTEPRRRGRAATRVLATLLFAVAAAGLAVHHLESPEPVVLVAASFAAAASLAAVGALLLAVVGRSALLALASIAVLGAAGVQYAPLFVGDRSPGEETPLVVLAQNLEFGHADPDAVVRAVEEHHVDVLAMVEMTPESVDALDRAGLRRLLPHTALAARPEATGVGIWSRYPIGEGHPHEGFELGVLSADIAGPTGPVTMVAAHPVAPVHDPVASPTDAERLRSLLAGLPGDRPVVVAGDFNATWDHVRFRSLREIGYTDSVAGGGDGYIPTWPSNSRIPPVLAIDHVLSRGDAGIGGTRSIRIPGTDHRGLLATVMLPALTSR